MKTKQCTLMALAALLFVACGNQSEPPVPAEKTAKIEITLAGTPAAVKPEGNAMAAVRSTGATLPTAPLESQIDRIAVGVFNSDGTVNVIREFTTEEVTAKKANVLCAPATGASVVVVANAPAAHFAGVTTKTAFNAKTVALSATVTGTASQAGDKLPMSGEQASITLTGGSTATATIAMSRLVGRVSISSIQTAFDPTGQYSAATFTLTSVFMYNAHTVSTVAPGAPMGSDPKSGEGPSTTYEYLRTDVNQAITGTAHTTPYWFYTFANDGSSTPTRLVLKGSFDPDGTGGAGPETVYYPITINKTQTGTTFTGGTGTATGNVAANATYTLTATIKGKGSTGPNVELIPATLELEVSVAPWALNIEQAVTFN